MMTSSPWSDIQFFGDLHAIFSVNSLREVVDSPEGDNGSLSLDVFYASGSWHASVWMTEVFVVVICILLLKRLVQFELFGGNQISMANSRRNFRGKMTFVRKLRSRMLRRESSWSRDLSERSGSSDSGMLDRFQSSCSDTELTDDRQDLLVEDATDVDTDFDDDDFFDTDGDDDDVESDVDDESDGDSCPSWYHEFYPIG